MKNQIVRFTLEFNPAYWIPRPIDFILFLLGIFAPRIYNFISRNKQKLKSFLMLSGILYGAIFAAIAGIVGINYAFNLTFPSYILSSSYSGIITMLVTLALPMMAYIAHLIRRSAYILRRIALALAFVSLVLSVWAGLHTASVLPLPYQTWGNSGLFTQWYFFGCSLLLLLTDYCSRFIPSSLDRYLINPKS